MWHLTVSECSLSYFKAKAKSIKGEIFCMMDKVMMLGTIKPHEGASKCFIINLTLKKNIKSIQNTEDF